MEESLTPCFSGKSVGSAAGVAIDDKAHDGIALNYDFTPVMADATS